MERTLGSFAELIDEIGRARGVLRVELERPGVRFLGGADATGRDGVGDREVEDVGRQIEAAVESFNRSVDSWTLDLEREERRLARFWALAWATSLVVVALMVVAGGLLLAGTQDWTASGMSALGAVLIGAVLVRLYQQVERGRRAVSEAREKLEAVVRRRERFEYARGAVSRALELCGKEDDYQRRVDCFEKSLGLLDLRPGKAEQ